MQSQEKLLFTLNIYFQIQEPLLLFFYYKTTMLSLS